MRDAFGGVFMMRLMLIFIFILVAFTAVSFKYAKSFKVKNRVIDYIEQNQIIDIDEHFESLNMNELDAILTSTNYNITCNEIGYSEGSLVDNKNQEIYGYCYRGVLIVKDKITDDKIYYKIKTYASWNLGILNNILSLGGQDPNSENAISGRWTITGQAIVVKK